MTKITSEIDEINLDAGVRIEDGWPHYREHSLFEAASIEAAREHQVSREMAMMCAFGAMATACQGLVDVELPTGHKVPTSLMLLTVAPSGERKTTALNYFFEEIFKQNGATQKEHELQVEEFQRAHQLWQIKKRHLESVYRKHASKEDIDAAELATQNYSQHLTTEPKPPRSNKFLYEDTTPPALVQMLHQNTSNGCLATSEANSIFSGKALGELDKLNTLWDGGNVIVDRISRDGFVLQNARLSLSLMAQPSVIARFMGKRGEEARGTGFLARFLVAKPREMAGERNHDSTLNLQRKKAFNSRILERLKNKDTDTRQILIFSEPAKEYWYEKSSQIENEMKENGVYYYLKDHASKLLENASRLSAILHTFERSSEKNIEIDKLTLKFCWNFATTCSRHFIENLANEPQIVTDASLLANYLLKKADTSQERTKYLTPRSDLIVGGKTDFSLSDIKQYGPSQLRGRANSERLDAAIGLLTKMGHIEKKTNRYNFRESILLKEGAPTLKNGDILTIKELPLFREQEYFSLEDAKHYSERVGYYIKTRKT